MIGGSNNGSGCDMAKEIFTAGSLLALGGGALAPRLLRVTSLIHSYRVVYFYGQWKKLFLKIFKNSCLLYAVSKHFPNGLKEVLDKDASTGGLRSNFDFKCGLAAVCVEATEVGVWVAGGVWEAVLKPILPRRIAHAIAWLSPADLHKCAAAVLGSAAATTKLAMALGRRQRRG